MSAITLKHTVQRRPEHVACQLEGDTVVMNSDTGDYFQLNNIGTRIWSLIETPRAVSAITETLRHEYEADEKTITREALDFLEVLLRRKLIALNETSL